MKITIRENHMEEIEDIAPAFPYTCHHVEMRNTKVPWHWHEELEFVRIDQGEAILRTAGKAIHLADGEGYFTNTNVLTALEGNTDTVVKSHIFHPVLLTGHYHSVFETKYINPVLQNKKIDVVFLRNDTHPQREILSRLMRIERLWEISDQEIQIRNLLSEIWIFLLDEIHSIKEMEVPMPSHDQERLQIMLSYIQEHAAEKISLEQIASSAVVSTRECLRCFKRGMDETPYEYLMEYRIGIARRMLRQSNASVLDIANESGFSNGAYFAKIFKRSTGKTPLQYRKNSNED